MNRWDIYRAELPFEEDPTQTKERPVVIAKDKIAYVLVVRVTSKDAREWDPFDYELQDWQAAGLNKPSTVRVAKLGQIKPDKIKSYMGRLSNRDIMAIQRLMVRRKQQKHES